MQINFDTKNEKNRKFIIHSRKNVGDFWLKFKFLRSERCRSVQKTHKCKSCRSRQELSNETDSYSNEYLLAKIGVDTAENEPLKVWRKIQFNIHSPP